MTSKEAIYAANMFDARALKEIADHARRTAVHMKGVLSDDEIRLFENLEAAINDILELQG